MCAHVLNACSMETKANFESRNVAFLFVGFVSIALSNGISVKTNAKNSNFSREMFLMRSFTVVRVCNAFPEKNSAE